MSEHRLLKHINPKDSRNLAPLYGDNYKYGEVKNILYKNLYNALAKGIEQVKVTLENLEHYKAGSLQGYYNIAPFQTLTNTSFLKQFNQMLEIDEVLLQSVKILEQSADATTVEIMW